MTRLGPSLALSVAAHGALAAALWLQLGNTPRASLTVLELVGPDGPAQPGAPAAALAPPRVPARQAVVPARRPAPVVPIAPARPEAAPALPAPARAHPAPAAPLAPAEGDEPPRPAGAGSEAAGAAGGGLLPPRIVSSELPRYPERARRAGIQGTTLLRVRVGADGAVGPVVIEQSSGHPELDEAAREAVAAWRFEPARRRGVPVDLWILLPVRFTLG